METKVALRAFKLGFVSMTQSLFSGIYVYSKRKKKRGRDYFIYLLLFFMFSAMFFFYYFILRKENNKEQYTKVFTILPSVFYYF